VRGEIRIPMLGSQQLLFYGFRTPRNLKESRVRQMGGVQ